VQCAVNATQMQMSGVRRRILCNQQVLFGLFVEQ
jgi:hypothetical protein